VKAGWQLVPLGDVCTIANGGTPKSNVATYWGGEVNWLTPKDMGQMNGRHIAVTPRKISAKGLDNCSARLVPAGSVIMSTRAPIGHLAINDKPMAFNQGCRGMIPGKELDPIFLYHFLAASTEALNELGTGTTFKELSATSLRAFLIPLPLLDEQKRIAAVLDEAFEGLSRVRANAEANLADARQIYASALQATFSNNSGATLIPLGDMIDISHGFAFDGSDFEPSNDQSQPIVLTPGNYSEDGALVFSDKNTKRLKVDPPKQYLFQRGDLTVVMTDLSSKMKILGKPAFISEDNLLHNQRIGRVLPKRRDCPLGYLYHFLNSGVARRRIMDTATGTMVRHTAPKRILDLRLPMPRNFEEVQEVTDRLDHCQMESVQLANRYAARTAQLDTLRQSLLQKAFSGELT
jgi:type I restriction enzyme S subunit